jgi:hypothetical protein
MKKIAILALALLTVLAMGATAADQLVQFKSGEVSFDLRTSDGVSPLADATIQMLSSEDSSVLAEAVSDEMGQAVIALDSGRYLLNISGANLAVMDVVDDATLSACRIIVPDAGMMIAGEEEEEEDDDDDKAAAWILPAAGVAAGIAILVGAGFIIDNNTKGHHHHDGEATPVPPTTPPAKHKKSKSGGGSSESAI